MSSTIYIEIVMLLIFLSTGGWCMWMGYQITGKGNLKLIRSALNHAPLPGPHRIADAYGRAYMWGGVLVLACCLIATFNVYPLVCMVVAVLIVCVMGGRLTYLAGPLENELHDGPKDNVQTIATVKWNSTVVLSKTDAHRTNLQKAKGGVALLLSTFASIFGAYQFLKGFGTGVALLPRGLEMVAMESHPFLYVMALGMWLFLALIFAAPPYFAWRLRKKK